MSTPLSLSRRTALAFGGALAAPAILRPTPGQARALGPDLSSSVLRDDFALLKRAYGALHPGLLRYHTPASLEGAWGRLEQAWAQGQSLGQAYLSLSRFLATVRCGHSYANFFNQKPATREALFAGRDKLPFRFAWMTEGMVVTGGGDAIGIPAGSIVLSVDGEPAARMLARLMPLVRADGHNDGKRRSLLSMQANDGIETFDVFNALTRRNTTDFTRLRVRLPDGRDRRLTLANLDLAGRLAGTTVGSAGPNDPAFTLDAPEPGILRLIMPGWALYNSRWDWRGFIDQSMDRAVEERARGLIVDLRGNEGGLDCGDAILARVAGSDITRAGFTRKVRFRRTPADLDPILDTWDNTFRSLGEAGRDVGDGFFTLPPRTADSGGVIQPKGRRFTGKMAVLIDAGNSSATFGFAALVRSSGLGTLIGETTGGNQRGINGGAFFFVRLPGTGLEVDLPLIGYFPPDQPPDGGLSPDILIRTTAADVAAGRDAVLARAIDWIGRG